MQFPGHRLCFEAQCGDDLPYGVYAEYDVPGSENIFELPLLRNGGNRAKVTVRSNLCSRFGIHFCSGAALILLYPIATVS